MFDGPADEIRAAQGATDDDASAPKQALADHRALARAALGAAAKLFESRVVTVDVSMIKRYREACSTESAEEGKQ